MSDQATIEVADELVDEASISDGKAIVRFTRTEAALADLEKRFKGVTFEMATTKGDTAARQARKELVSLRTGLDRRRKELKAPAVEFNRKIDSEAQRITAAVVALEEPIDQQIKADEIRREDERLERLRAEEARCDAHRQRITAMTDVAVRAVGLSSAEIQAKVELVTRLVIDSSFEEFEATAVNAKATTLLSLADLLSNAKAQEEAAERARLDRERLEQLERENAERVQRETAERKERERVEAEQRRVEQERVAAEQRAAAKRTAQSNAANALVEEIRVIQRRGMKASATGMLELVSLVENLAIGDELGDFQGVAQKARDDALADLHDLHETKVTSEAEERRVRDEQAAAQRRLDDQAAALRQQQEEVAARERAMAPPPEPEPPVQASPPADSVVNDFASVSANAAKALEILPSLVPLITRGPGLAAMQALGALTDAAGDPGDDDDVDGEGNTPDAGTDLMSPVDFIDHGMRLAHAVAAMMKTTTSTLKRGRKPGPWVVQHDEMLAVKAALRAVALPGGQFYAEDGTLMSADGTRRFFDNVGA